MEYLLEKPVEGTIGTTKYQCTVTWRNGTFISDEPIKSGGKDMGPDPYTLLLASLATCTLMTVRMYIDRKGWTIDNIGIAVNMFQTIKGEGITTTLDRTLKFMSPVTEEQRKRLEDIAGHCPISKIIQGEVVVRTFSADDAKNSTDQ